MIDLFWEQPFAFSDLRPFALHRQMTDAFAAHLEFEHQPSPSMMSFRKLLKRTPNTTPMTIPSRSAPVITRARPLWRPDHRSGHWRMDRGRGGGLDLVEGHRSRAQLPAAGIVLEDEHNRRT